VTAPLVATDLDGLDLTVAAGELVALVGPSLTGKTTRLDAMAGWVAPPRGEVRWFGGAAVPPWSSLAIVPQAIALIEELTVGENVGLAHAGRKPAAGALDGALLERLGIGHLVGRGGYEISIGERQRTMVARALNGNPGILLADEPVAHQDALRAEAVLELLRERADAGAAVVLATRDPEFATLADRVLEAPFGRG
jgi:putative ABC transport system ATP-binding protein